MNKKAQMSDDFKKWFCIISAFIAVLALILAAYWEGMNTICENEGADGVYKNRTCYYEKEKSFIWIPESEIELPAVAVD